MTGHVFHGDGYELHGLIRERSGWLWPAAGDERFARRHCDEFEIWIRVAYIVNQHGATNADFSPDGQWTITSSPASGEQGLQYLTRPFPACVEEQYVSYSLFTGGLNSVTRAAAPHLMDQIVDYKASHPQMARAKVVLMSNVKFYTLKQIFTNLFSPCQILLSLFPSVWNLGLVRLLRNHALERFV